MVFLIMAVHSRPRITVQQIFQSRSCWAYYLDILGRYQVRDLLTASWQHDDEESNHEKHFNTMYLTLLNVAYLEDHDHTFMNGLYSFSGHNFDR